MKAELLTQELREAVNICGVAVARRSTLLICASVAVVTEGNKLVVKATDLETYVKTSVSCKTEDALAACIPYRAFSRFIGKGNGKVTMEVVGNAMTLARPDMGKMRTSVQKPTDFPLLSEPTEVDWHTLEGKEFCRMLGIVSQSCATEDSRPILTGVCFKDGAIAAADGFRLYVIESDKLDFGLGKTEQGKKEAIITLTTVQKIIKVFGKKDKLEIGFQYNKASLVPQMVFVRSGETLLGAQLVQGHFPHYNQLVPTEFSFSAEFSVPLMLERVDMISAQEVSGGSLRVRFSRTEKNEELCYLGAKADELEYELSLPVRIKKETPHEEGKVVMNIAYITPAIKAFSLCRMELTSPSSPIKFTGDIKGLTVVVMPMF